MATALETQKPANKLLKTTVHINFYPCCFGLAFIFFQMLKFIRYNEV